MSQPSNYTVKYLRNTQLPLVIPEPKKLARSMSIVYLWSVFGLLITALSAWMVYGSLELQQIILNNEYCFYGLLITQLVCVFGFSEYSSKCRKLYVFLMYFIYAFLSGLTTSIIFLRFQLPSIVLIFICTSIAFLGLSFYGYITKRNLSGMGVICIASLFSLLILYCMYFLIPALHTDMTNLALTILGTIIFIGLTAYDVQAIKENLLQQEQEGKCAQAITIQAALLLYLDFINLFIRLLSLFGKQK